MPICVECRTPVSQLYTSYSKADDRSLGKGVRLTQCPRCRCFADKYVEHDFVVLFIDLVLIKPQVYRHLLFNRLHRSDDRFDPSIIRLGILLLLFDVYLTWARIEKASPTSNGLPPSGTASDESQSRNSQSSLLSAQPLFLQYLFFLFLVAVTTLALHLPIRLLCTYVPPWLAYRPGHPTAVSPVSTDSKKDTSVLPIIPYYPHPAHLSTALLVSSCTKLFPILLIIWEYDLPSSASAVNWAVIVNNVAALEILMDCGYLRAALLVGIGAFCRSVVSRLVLGCVGLGGEGDLERMLSAMGDWWGQ